MKAARWWIALALAAFGAAAVGNWTSPKWVALTLALYLVPLGCQLLPWRTVQTYGLWFGVFLVLQTLITPLAIERNFVTLPPNLEERIDVRGNAIPGISGLQTITTDEMGFRVTRDVDYENKPPGTFRVFALGGSTTEQILLDDRRTWTHLLQQRLGDSGRFGTVEVVNTGVSGTRAIQHLATLRRIAAWQPDLVVILMGINDWNRAIWEAEGASQRDNPGVAQSPIQFSQSLLGKAVMAFGAAGAERPAADVRPEYGEYYSQQNDSLARSDVRSLRPDSVSEPYRDAVDAIAAECRGRELRCMLVSQPTAYSEDASQETKSNFWMTPPNTSYTLELASMIHVSRLYNGFLMDYAARQDLLRCDLAPRLAPTVEVFYDDCHFNVSGAERVAAELASCIVGSVDAAR